MATEVCIMKMKRLDIDSLHGLVSGGRASRPPGGKRKEKGKAEELVGRLQKRYGYAREKAAEEYKGFIGRYQKPPSGEKVK